MYVSFNKLGEPCVLVDVLSNSKGTCMELKC